MSVSELIEAFADAHALIRHARNAALDDAGDADASCSQRLDARLRMMKGVPTAVGSGKRSLRRIAHSLVHSVRLEASSWPAACDLLNSTVSFTGDLGTESGLWRFRSLVPELFGEWVAAWGDEAADDEECMIRTMLYMHVTYRHLYLCYWACRVSCGDPLNGFCDVCRMPRRNQKTDLVFLSSCLVKLRKKEISCKS